MNLQKPKPILNRNELKQIKQSRTKVEGKKVITDDVRKLKTLKVTPELAPDEQIRYYKEPIWIEYYIPKESRFALEIKYLYVLLIDVVPRKSDIILKEAIEKDSFIDLFQLIEDKKEYSKQIQTSYKNHLGMLETIYFNMSQYSETKDIELLKIPLYLTEVIMGFEPTLAALEWLGDYALPNLHWLIKKIFFGRQNNFSFD
jgi:bifunctional DNA-binding transcriptional regulator/antitoxin component of YhaV-PrlF toxin-antitoxin module